MDITVVIKFLMLIISSFFFICFVNSINYWGNSIDRGEVFGICIESRKRNVIKIVILGILFMFFGFESFGTVLYLLFSQFKIFVIYFVMVVGVLAISLICNYKSGIVKCAKEKNALILGELDLIKYIDSKVELSDSFAVGYEAVEVCSKEKKEKVYYSDYGHFLTTERELALLGMYFLQRHHSKFKIKVESETIQSCDVQENTESSWKYVNVEKLKKRIVLKNYIFIRK